MSQFRKCPDCGANLDAGERCDCKDIKREEEKQEEEDVQLEH